jgi:hypothetical protein
LAHNHSDLAPILRTVDLGSSVAEQDDLLATARVETSVFEDLLRDRVDLVPGTKGSGKSALYRIFVDFLAPRLLQLRKVVIAHGVQRHGDNVFLAFHDTFDGLSEDEFVDFWCIYLVSLAHEQFVKNSDYEAYLGDCDEEIRRFRQACAAARIPEIDAPRSLRDVLEWALNALRGVRPRLAATSPEGWRYEATIFGDAPSTPPPTESNDPPQLPRHISDVRDSLEGILKKADLTLWLMVDRLDEIFPRRSAVETRALRALLRTLRIFTSGEIRVKVFLRDDILEQVTAVADGFTALTHVTARQADTITWSEDGILTMVVRRLFTSSQLAAYLDVDPEQLSTSRDYRELAFYRVFPPTVHRQPNQSRTLRWIYSHTMDGLGVVTPRDVIDLLTKAKQRQQDEYEENPAGQAEHIISASAIRYGLTELSRRKRDTVLRAELPHLWPHIEKLRGQKSEYSEGALSAILGKQGAGLISDLVSIGLLSETRSATGSSYKMPFLFREGLEVTQGRMT